VVTVVAICITIFPARPGHSHLQGSLFRLRRQAAGPDPGSDDISEIVQHYLLYLIVLAGAGSGAGSFHQDQTGRDFWDKQRIRLPIFGVIATKSALPASRRTLASLGPQRRADSGSPANRVPDRRGQTPADGRYRHGKTIQSAALPQI